MRRGLGGDAMSRLPRVYLAGKIGHTDWRHELFPLRHVELHYDREHDRIEALERLTRDGFEYAGPFFLGDDHGCFHGPGQHGLIDPGYADGHCMAEDDFPQQLERRTVMRSCLHWVAQSDAVFCWLSGLDAYGTLVELGYAHARGIPIYVATDGAVLKAHTASLDAAMEEQARVARPHEMLPRDAFGDESPWSEWWFAREIAANFEHEWSVTDAWQGFAQWWTRRGTFDPERRRLWVVEAR